MSTATRLSLLSVIIPARDEQECITTTLEKIAQTLSLNQVPHEILVVDDGSTDQTWKILTTLEMRLPRLRVMRNPGPYGFGRAVSYGLDHMAGDKDLPSLIGAPIVDHKDFVRHLIQAQGLGDLFERR